jgi:[ribosomal protein S5]-alanine N-acetyltransferase
MFDNVMLRLEPGDVARCVIAADFAKPDKSTHFLNFQLTKLLMSKHRPAIATQRLLLRPFQADDLDLFSEFFVNERFMAFSSGPFSRERVAEFIHKVIGWEREGLPSQYVVVRRRQGVPIGYCGFFHQQVDHQPEIEIGYRLHPAAWGKGFATEAARAVRDEGFTQFKLERAISLIHPDHTASRRVAEKNGMTFERATTFKGFPTQVFAISRSDWVKHRGV